MIITKQNITKNCFDGSEDKNPNFFKIISSEVQKVLNNVFGYDLGINIYHFSYYYY